MGNKRVEPGLFFGCCQVQDHRRERRGWLWFSHLFFYLKLCNFLTQELEISSLQLACTNNQNTFMCVCFMQLLFKTVLACSSAGADEIPPSLFLEKSHPNILEREYKF